MPLSAPTTGYVPTPTVVNAARSLLTLKDRGEEVPRTTVDALLSGRALGLIAPGPHRDLVAAGRIHALILEGDEDAATSYARTALESRKTSRTETKAWETGHFFSAAAKALLHAGRITLAGDCAMRALDYAKLAKSPAAEYRALSHLALAQSLNGEFLTARASIARAEDIAETESLKPIEAAGYLFCARLLTAYTLGDTDGLRAIVAQAQARAYQNAAWRLVASLAGALGQQFARNPDSAVANVSWSDAGSDVVGIPSLMRAFLTNTHAAMVIAGGEPLRALSILDSSPSTYGHVVCVQMQKASAYLYLGRPTDVLLVTQPCVELGVHHCLRTRIAVLFRRAIALLRLGELVEADRAFAEGFHLMVQSGGMAPMLSLPRADLTVLWERLTEHYPEIGLAHANVAEALSTAPEPRTPRVILPALTPREEVLARELAGSATLAEIASELFVSRNTLKSQSRSLYARLGVTTRAEAVTLLRGAGFFDGLAPRE